MRETYFWYEFTEEERRAREEQSRLSQGGISLAFEAPSPYDGEVLEYDEGGADGSRSIKPTPFTSEPVDAGFIDVPIVAAVASADGTTALDPVGGLLRIEQHPSVYGTPVRLVMRCNLSNGSTPNQSSIITSTPITLNGAIHIEVAMNLTPSSAITQEMLLDTISNLTYGGQFILIPSIGIESTAPIVAFKTIENYTQTNLQFQDLCVDIFTLQTTAGNANAKIVSGLPHIEGLFEQNRLLTVNLIDITDRDSDFSYSYQWYREELVDGLYQNSPITSGGDGAFYIVKGQDVGKNLTVSVAYINNAGDAVQKNSPPVFIKNTPATGEISISAESYRVGNYVYATYENFRDRNGIQFIGNKRWQRSNVIPRVINSDFKLEWFDIENSDSTSYQIQNEDQGKRLRFVVDIVDTFGSITSVASNASIRTVNQEPTDVSYTLEGEPNVGKTITGIIAFQEYDYVPAGTGGTTDGHVGAATVRWYRNGIEIPDSLVNKRVLSSEIDYPKYLVRLDDYGKQITSKYTYVDERGYEQTIESDSIGIVSSSPTGLQITGTNEVSGTLFADISSLYDTDITTKRFYTGSNGETKSAAIGKPITENIEYRWKSENVFLTSWGNENTQFLVEDSYYGKEIELFIRYPDELLDGVYKQAQTSVEIVNSLPQGNISITGSIIGVGLPLTMSLNNISDINTPYYESEVSGWDFNYSLNSINRTEFTNGSTVPLPDVEIESGTIKGDETVVYTVDKIYNNSTIKAIVSYTDGKGVIHSFSDSINIPGLAKPVIIGNKEQGDTIYLDTSTVENYVSTNSIKWFYGEEREGNYIEIIGENNSQLQILLEHVEKYIYAELTYTTNNGDEEIRNTEPILTRNSLPTGTFYVQSDLSREYDGFGIGHVLTASYLNLEDKNGVSEINYQWWRNGGPIGWDSVQGVENIVPIGGANQQHYTITEQDASKFIMFIAYITDNTGKINEIRSERSNRKVYHLPLGSIRVTHRDENGVYNFESAGIGDTLTIDYGAYRDFGGINSRQFQWFVDGEKVSENSSIVVKSEYYNKTITATINYVDLEFGESKSSTSSNSILITGTAPTGLFISGTPLPTNVLKADITYLKDPDGLPSEQFINFQWYLDGQLLDGETTKEISIEREDYNKEVKVEATYTDGKGNLEIIQDSVTVLDSTPTGKIQFSSSFVAGEGLYISAENVRNLYGPDTQEELEQTLFEYTIYKFLTSIEYLETYTGTFYGNEKKLIYTLLESDLEKLPQLEGSTIKVNYGFEGSCSFQDSKQTTKTVGAPRIRIPDRTPPDSGGGGEEEEGGGSGPGFSVPGDTSYTGPLNAYGAGYKTVKIETDTDLIVYNELYEPNVSSFILTANAFNHFDDVYYRFYLLLDSGDQEILPIESLPNNQRKIYVPSSLTPQIYFRVDTYEPTSDLPIAGDVITIFSIKEQ